MPAPTPAPDQYSQKLRVFEYCWALAYEEPSEPKYVWLERPCPECMRRMLQRVEWEIELANELAMLHKSQRAAEQEKTERWEAQDKI
jgi:hypothetical protein